MAVQLVFEADKIPAQGHTSLARMFWWGAMLGDAAGTATCTARNVLLFIAVWAVRDSRQGG